MAIFNSGDGAWVGGAASVLPAIPATAAVGEMMIMFVGCKPHSATIVTPSGWTLLGNRSNGTVASGPDVGSVRWALFSRVFVAGDVGPTVTVTDGGTTLAQINVFTIDTGGGPDEGWEPPVETWGSDNSSGTGFSLVMDSDRSVVAGDMLVHYAALPGNNATFGTPTISVPGTTVDVVVEVPVVEGTNVQGDRLEASCSHANCLTGASTGVPTCGWTLSVAQTGGGSVVRLREHYDKRRPNQLVMTQSQHASVA